VEERAQRSPGGTHLGAIHRHCASYPAAPASSGIYGMAIGPPGSKVSLLTAAACDLGAFLRLFNVRAGALARRFIGEMNRSGLCATVSLITTRLAGGRTATSRPCGFGGLTMRGASLRINRDGRYEEGSETCFPATYDGYSVTVCLHPDTLSDLAFEEGDLGAAFDRLEHELLLEMHRLEDEGRDPAAQSIHWMCEHVAT
jgi:hypothetical protein